MVRQLKVWGLSIAAFLWVISLTVLAQANPALTVVYPVDGHETTASRIFFIGTAPASETVTINGQPVANRSPAGHFAPSLPLQLGDNRFTFQAGEQTLTLRVTRQSDQPPAPVGATFGEGSLTPVVDVARMPGELVCFGAIAPTRAQVTVTLGTQTIALLPQPAADLPPNSAVLTDQNEPVTAPAATRYQGCAALMPMGTALPGNPVLSGTMPGLPQSLNLGRPEYRLQWNGQTYQQIAPGSVTLLSTHNPQVIQVTAPTGTARTGPSTDFSRLTPLPTGTRAAVTGREGEWFRMDYGAWIRARDVQVLPNATLPQSLIRSARSRQVPGWTEILFPLQVPVPLSIDQGDRSFTLTLYNTTAQTDTIRTDDDPIIERLEWTQPAPQQVRYLFRIKSTQQWGYKTRYEGTTLILSLRHPPGLANGQSSNVRSSQKRPSSDQPLSGTRILIDPGHGGPEDTGAVGPTGYPEKAAVLVTSNLLKQDLEQRGATVIITRTADVDLGVNERADIINQQEPTLSLSIHYNALPDAGDALNTKGVSTFWYNTQAHSLAMFLHNYLVKERDRPSAGVFWNNLALTRPTVAPTVLLELGFMINPVEFEWIVNAEEQEKLAEAIAEGVVQWLQQTTH